MHGKYTISEWYFGSCNDQRDKTRCYISCAKAQVSDSCHALLYQIIVLLKFYNIIKIRELQPVHSKCAVRESWKFFSPLQSLPSSIPPDGNDRLDKPSGCQDNGYRRVTENPWQCKHTAAVQTTTVFWPEQPLTGVICCINLQLGPVWLLSGFRALGQKRRTPCPLTKGLALIGVDKACWWSLFEQLNLVNES